MSKASEAAKALGRARSMIDVGLPEFDAASGECAISVAESGGLELWISGQTVELEPDQAVALGRWLLDTFGEREEAGA